MNSTPIIIRDSLTFDYDIINAFRNTGHCLISKPFPHYTTIMNHLRSRLDEVFKSENSAKKDEPWHNETTERIFNPHSKTITTTSDFPEDLRKLCDVVYKASRQLGLMVLRSFDLEFGTNLVECHTPTETVKDGSHMVLIKYLEKTSSSDQRMRHHCDIGTVSVLHVFDKTEDLEIRTDRETSNWTTVHDEEVVAVNIGETLQAWLNDKIIAVPHRVVNKHNKRRYSMPVFMGVGQGAPMPEHVLQHRNYLKRIEQDDNLVLPANSNVEEFVNSLSSDQLDKLKTVFHTMPQEDPDDIYIPVPLNTVKNYYHLQKLFDIKRI